MEILLLHKNNPHKISCAGYESIPYFILKEKYENKFKAYYTYEKGKNYTFLLIKIENVDLYKNQIKIW